MNISPKGTDRSQIDKEDKRYKRRRIMKRLRDFLEVEKEERIMRHILSREGILF